MAATRRLRRILELVYLPHIGRETAEGGRSSDDLVTSPDSLVYEISRHQASSRRVLLLELAEAVPRRSPKTQFINECRSQLEQNERLDLVLLTRTFIARRTYECNYDRRYSGGFERERLFLASEQRRARTDV